MLPGTHPQRWWIHWRRVTTKRRGCLFFLTSQMLDYSDFLSSCWVLRGFEDLGKAREMWVTQHPWMNLPHLQPLSAVHMSIELETFPWRTDHTSKTCCSFHLEASQWAHFKKKLFSVPVILQKNLPPLPPITSYVGLCLKGVVWLSVQKEWLDVDSSTDIWP